MRHLLFIALIFTFFSCKKSEDRRCLKVAGTETTIERDLDDFTKIFIGPNIHVSLVQDSLDKVVITGGENLVNFISSDIVDGELQIENINKCNFLRSYKHQVFVEIHLTTLTKVYFEGTKPLVCNSVINGNNLSVIIRDGAGEVDLDVNYNNLDFTVTNGWGNFVLKGNVNKLNLNIWSNGFGDAYGLNVANDLEVVSNTAGLLKVNADGANLKVEISSIGDVWYLGNPTDLLYTKYGAGELLDKN